MNIKQTTETNLPQGIEDTQHVPVVEAGSSAGEAIKVDVITPATKPETTSDKEFDVSDAGKAVRAYQESIRTFAEGVSRIH